MIRSNLLDEEMDIALYALIILNYVLENSNDLDELIISLYCKDSKFLKEEFNQILKKYKDKISKIKNVKINEKYENSQKDEKNELDELDELPYESEDENGE